MSEPHRLKRIMYALILLASFSGVYVTDLVCKLPELCTLQGQQSSPTHDDHHPHPAKLAGHDHAEHSDHGDKNHSDKDKVDFGSCCTDETASFYALIGQTIPPKTEIESIIQIPSVIVAHTPIITSSIEAPEITGFANKAPPLRRTSMVIFLQSFLI